MSFVDLATLALHRRSEMEARINNFITTCDSAIYNVVKLKTRAQNFVHEINCEPSELRERFLNCMKQLDEYIYLITEFNLSVGQLQLSDSTESTPVHDSSTPLIPTLVPHPANIIDILSEPTPSTSTACPNQCPLEKPKHKKIPKTEQQLIQFSSASCSAESVPMDRSITTGADEREVKCEITTGLNNITLSEPATQDLNIRKLPAQTALETDHVYPAIIMSIDGPSIYVITAAIDEVYSVMIEMTSFYKKHRVEMTLNDIKKLTYCSFYDGESDCYYRALFIGLSEDDKSEASVYLVDTGEVRCGPALRALQPLDAQFYGKPPYARCCHLAGVELKDFQKQEEFMKQYEGVQCYIEVDDDTSESLGVYVILLDKKTLNDILVEKGFASEIDTTGPVKASPPASGGPPELAAGFESELDLGHGPEYDDPVEAVMGYKCRDDADICKHYKGGPEKTCFKGTRCTKKHILKHPDGWTLDRVEVLGKCRTLPLPAPGSWLRVHVTCICHFDRLFVQFVTKKTQESLPSFGVILPPTTLDALVRDMNSPATRITYKPVTLIPSPGEMVAAKYPPDEQWYRARVLSVTRADQCVEVMYVDYGNVLWVKEDAICVLERRFLALPVQAVRCLLAGVAARGADSRQWADAKTQLAAMAQDRELDAHVIARDYEEITIELFDAEGYSIAEQLAARKLVDLKEYDVIDDTNVKQKLVVP